MVTSENTQREIYPKKQIIKKAESAQDTSAKPERGLPKGMLFLDAPTEKESLHKDFICKGEKMNPEDILDKFITDTEDKRPANVRESYLKWAKEKHLPQTVADNVWEKYISKRNLYRNFA